MLITEGVFCVQTVQQRGAAVIASRKLSSAMSAAKATCDHLRDWWHGTKEVGQFALSFIPLNALHSSLPVLCLFCDYYRRFEPCGHGGLPV